MCGSLAVHHDERDVMRGIPLAPDVSSSSVRPRDQATRVRRPSSRLSRAVAGVAPQVYRGGGVVGFSHAHHTTSS